MIKITGTKISLTRGDSAYITVNILNSDGTPYELQEDDNVRCQIRTAPSTGILLYCADRESGNVFLDDEGELIWYIQPADTKDLDIGTYYWDAQLETSNGDIFTFISPSPFRVSDEVTF